MKIRLDPAKDQENRKKHGISLERAQQFDFAAAKYFVDDSQAYGELRFIALGFLDAKMHVVVFVEESDGAARIISLRKAEPAERREYADEF